MNNNKDSILAPQYMRQFSCIGSACEDSCCVGWRVNIDQVTYSRYQKIRDPELSPLIEKHVRRNRSSPTTDNYAKIRMKPDKSCAFLTEEKLCSIQSKLGEDSLSEVCNTYPRIASQVNGVMERSATVSCPEIARLALLNRDGIEFEQISEPSQKQFRPVAGLHTWDHKAINEAQRYFWELRIFTIQVLQNRTYTLADRLIILGMFLKKADELVTNRQADQIPQAIATYTAFMNDGSLTASLASIPEQTNLQLELVKEMVDERFMQGVSNQRYLDCLRDMLLGLHYKVDTPYEDTVQAYRNGYNEHYLPFMNEHGYILENYLVNYVFQKLFPVYGANHMFDNYVLLVVHYAMIKLHFIGMGAHHQGLSINLALTCIQSFSKTVEHNALFLRRLFDLIEKNQFNTMPYMAILIKN